MLHRLSRRLTASIARVYVPLGEAHDGTGQTPLHPTLMPTVHGGLINGQSCTLIYLDESFDSLLSIARHCDRRQVAFSPSLESHHSDLLPGSNPSFDQSGPSLVYRLLSLLILAKGSTPSAGGRTSNRGVSFPG